MRRTVGLVLGLAIALLVGMAILLSAIPPLSTDRAGPKRLRVITTIFPLYDFSREVGGDRLDVVKLLPPGVEAHTFEPKPRDMVTIGKADVFVYTGKYMEPWVEDLLKGVSNRKLIVVDASKGVELMDETASQEEGHRREQERGGKDPHIWLDLSYAQTMTRTIAEAMGQADPQDKDFYMARAESYQAKLADLDARFKAALSTCKVKTIVYGGHFAFGYFAKRYGLKHVSPYPGFSPDAEPSPRSIQQLIETFQATGSEYIYYEELVAPRIARVIADETGAKLLLLNGAHNISKEDFAKGVTFLAIMEKNLAALKEGLQCQ